MPEEPEPEPAHWYDSLPGLQLLDGLEPLKPREAKSKLDRVAKVIKYAGELADEAIPIFSRTHADAAIWSTLNAEECETLASLLVDLGKEYVIAAQVVRGLDRSYYLWQAGVITGPRIKATVGYYVRNGFLLSFGIRPRERIEDALRRVA